MHNLSPEASLSIPADAAELIQPTESITEAPSYMRCDTLTESKTQTADPWPSRKLMGIGSQLEAADLHKQFRLNRAGGCTAAPRAKEIASSCCQEPRSPGRRSSSPEKSCDGEAIPDSNKAELKDSIPAIFFSSSSSFSRYVEARGIPGSKNRGIE
ncbi:hypothetical protein BDV19DRAFT_70048 [Aspergillus venezuelensis]